MEQHSYNRHGAAFDVGRTCSGVDHRTGQAHAAVRDVHDDLVRPQVHHRW